MAGHGGDKLTQLVCVHLWHLVDRTDYSDRATPQRPPEMPCINPAAIPPVQRRAWRFGHRCRRTWKVGAPCRPAMQPVSRGTACQVANDDL